MERYKEKFLPYKKEYLNNGVKYVILFGELNSTERFPYNKGKVEMRILNWT